MISLSHSLSLGSTALEKDEDPHPPASPIHILAVTSTPTLNTGGQSEELGSDGGNTPPRLGRKVFSPTSSKDEARDFRQELGGFCFVPLLPKAVMTPTHWSHPSSKNQIVVGPQFS